MLEQIKRSATKLIPGLRKKIEGMRFNNTGDATIGGGGGSNIIFFKDIEWS